MSQCEDGTFLCLRKCDMIDLTGISAELHDGVSALAGEMRTHGYQRDEPVREIFSLLGDRWTMLILLVLAIGSFRHAELQRTLGRLGAEGKISQRVLTLKLRMLERDGLVTRAITPDVPPKVSYALSPLGVGLVGQARTLLGWVQAHRKAIESARDSFDGLNE
jgi:DNA-binding HxlR family transcriptional regulator